MLEHDAVARGRAIGELATLPPSTDLLKAVAEIKSLEDCKRVVWDFDPGARGGPVFETADELISYLNSNA